jgi:phenylpropionate dioxygenase-like ring-hydroxylating dioxygenase large terminal subunit
MSQMSFVPSTAVAAARLADIDAGIALPTQWYRDPDVHALELERIHRRAWHFATHTGDLPNPGDVYLRNIAGVPIVLVRDDGGAVRGFVNICRHRGYPVVTEVGNRKVLQCHYHAWKYRLDGTLLNAPHSEDDPTFDPDGLGLLPVATHVWGAMIWVNLDTNAMPFSEWIGGMPELMKERGLTVENHVFGFDNTWEIDANWKVFQDNSIECYHCPTTHPELSRVLEMKQSKQGFYVGGKYWIHHRIPFRPGITSGITFKATPGEQLYYYYYWVFPTTYIQHAGRGFDIGSLDVIAVDKIRFRHICFLPADTPAEILAKGKKQLDVDATIWQDVDICNRVQVGHRTGVAPPARFVAAPEFLLAHFQRLVVEMVCGSSAA